MRISDWSSDVCSSDLVRAQRGRRGEAAHHHRGDGARGRRGRVIAPVVPPPRPQRRGGFVSVPRFPGGTTMQVLRTAADRGHVKTGWLDRHHTFSFGHYHDPSWMGWGPLRVINEDRVAPGAGFPPPGHAQLEVISYVRTDEHTSELHTIIRNSS